MALLIATALLLAQSAVATNTHYCKEYSNTSAPAAPLNVAAVDVTSSSITWIWDKPSNHSNKVTHYQVSNGSTIDAVVTAGTYYNWTGLTANTSYEFRVRAVTGSGNPGNWSSWESVYTLPQVPSCPNVSLDRDSITARSVILTLSRCTDVGTVKFIVRYSFTGGNVLTAETDTSNSQLAVTELRPEMNYTFTVTCENSAGANGPNETRQATTLSEDTLQPAISSVQISNSLDSADVVWSAPSARVTVDGYDVRVVPHVGGIPQSPIVYPNATSNAYSTSYRVVQSFAPETEYTFQVRALTSVGTSQWSTPVVRSTPTADTFQPVILSVVTNDTQATVHWEALDTLLNVTGYDILALDQAGVNPPGSFSVSLTVNQDTLCKVVGELLPETVYTFQVRARTPVGMSQWSEPFVRCTLPAVPPVHGLTASSPTSTSIALTWTLTTATVEYYALTLHNEAANTTEHIDLFRTVNSYTFHNLSPNTAYSVTIITTGNKAVRGPAVSMTVTTQQIDGAVSPLVITTGTLGAVVVMVIVAVPLLIGFTWWVSKTKGKTLKRSDSDYNCELQENVAYVKNPLNNPWSEACIMEDEDECEGENTSASGVAIELEPTSPQIPSRKYLQEKKKGPTVFASIPVFDDIGFKEKSGWYKPTVADVIAGKLDMDVVTFVDLGPGVYFIHHRAKEQAKWVGLSPDLCRTLCGLFFQLYQKEHSELSPLEVELKFFSPLAADWDIKVWTADPKDLVVERAKKIVEYKTLKPLGLNNALKFTTKEMWEEFTSWFAVQDRQQS